MFWFALSVTSELGNIPVLSKLVLKLLGFTAKLQILTAIPFESLLQLPITLLHHVHQDLYFPKCVPWNMSPARCSVKRKGKGSMVKCV